jgi:predicted GH43/DUF377 family glycosyl hydrolase
MLKTTAAVVALLVTSALAVHAQTDTANNWMLGPFTKQDDVNPILVPRSESTFSCPIRKTSVQWETKDVFNPAAVVRHDTVFLLYRAQDRIGKPAGTSRIGLAWSIDGRSFARHPVPVLYPAEDFMKVYEWEGGCEDPRVVEDERGVYVMTYTAYDGETARLCVATSGDLYHWKKEGPAFGRAGEGRFANMWSKSGSIITRRVGDRNIAMKISNRYWMYWGEGNINLAMSLDLIHWKPVETDNKDLLPALVPRKGFFDSGLVEPGPPATLTTGGILLLYNGSNSREDGSRELSPGTYSGGQVLADSTNPSHILRRGDTPFIKPDQAYEVQGQVNYVCFIEGLVHFKHQWLLYYGTADSRIALAVAHD